MRGISMTETLIALPIVILFVLAILQFGLIYRAKITLEYAAHEAARSGALNNGLPLPLFAMIPASGGMKRMFALDLGKNVFTRGSVWQGLVKGMMPLYAKDNSIGELANAWGRTNIDLIKSACIEYLNPTQQTFLDWAIIENTGESRWLLQIPNDTLRYRKPLPYDYDAQAMTTAGAATNPLPPEEGLKAPVSNKTLGEANVLHLRVHYGYELKIPIVNTLIIKSYQAMDWLSGDERYPLSSLLKKNYIEKGMIPLSAEGVVGMESPVYWHPFYSFGEETDMSDANLNWNDAWASGFSNTSQVLEYPRDAITTLVGFIHGDVITYLKELMGVGVSELGGVVKDYTSFCPAIWAAGVTGRLQNLDNQFQN